MYLLKTYKKPFNHIEFKCGARLTNCVMGGSEIMAVDLHKPGPAAEAV